MPGDHALLQETVSALEGIAKAFAPERKVLLACAIVSFMILVAVLALFILGRISWIQFAGNLGSSGLVVYSAGRVSFILNKSIDAISEVAKLLAANRITEDV